MDIPTRRGVIKPQNSTDWAKPDLDLAASAIKSGGYQSALHIREASVLLHFIRLPHLNIEGSDGRHTS